MSDIPLPLVGGSGDAPKVRPYQPSNGTEGEIFMGRWCALCEHDRAHREDPTMTTDGCQIIDATMALKISDPDYPKEWVEDHRGPRCTAFQEERKP